MAKPKYRAYVCCGPNCGPKGSLSLLKHLEEEVARLGLEETVSVSPTGCQSHCESGPTMVVFPGPVYYQEVDRERLARIVAEHLVAGRPVPDFFWQENSRRKSARKEPAVPFVPGNTKKELPHQKGGKPTKRRPLPEEVDDFKW